MVRVNAAVFYTTADDPPEVHPALVARVNGDNTIDLHVFLPEETWPVLIRNVPPGRGPHSWFDPISIRGHKNKP